MERNRVGLLCTEQADRQEQGNTLLHAQVFSSAGALKLRSGDVLTGSNLRKATTCRFVNQPSRGGRKDIPIMSPVSSRR